MHPEFSAFLRLHKKTCRVGPESALLDSQQDIQQRPLRVDSQQYLDELYVPRQVETLLQHRLRDTSELICLVGPQGAGKTSLASRLVREFMGSSLHRVFITYLDIRTEEVMKACETGSREEFEDYLRDRIIGEYLRALFPFKRGDHSQRLALLAYLLTAQDEVTRPSKIFFPYRELEEQIARKIMKHEQVEESIKEITTEEWLSERYIKDPEVAKLVEAAEQLIDIHHLVYAARFVQNYDRQIIWIDNIDALPEALQPEAVHFARRFHNLITSYVATVVAVREENVFRFEDLNDENAPPYESRVLLEMPRDESNHTFYPLVDIPVLTKDQLREIIDKRLDFTQAIQRRAYERYEESVSDLREEAGPGENDTEKKAAELQLEAADYLEPISDARFTQLKTLSSRLLKTLWSEGAVYISNNSIRDILLLHRDCLGYLLRSPNEDEEPPEALSYSDWYRATLFYTWIRVTGRTYTVEGFDIVSRTRDWHREESSSLGCLLPYLLITTIWNCTLEGGRGRGAYGQIPRITDVMERLEVLGFKEEEILRALHRQYFHNGRRGHCVEIRSRYLINNWRKIDPNFFVYVTFRGKCLALRTGNSFGYTYECVRRLGVENVEEPPSHPGKRETGEAAQELLPHLCDVAEMHVRSLVRIRDSCDLGDDWLPQYYRWFGLPQLDPYRWKVKIGRRLGDVRRALQFQCLIAGVIGAARHTSAESYLRKLENQFASAVDRLGETGPDEPFSVPEFRSALNLPSRSVES